MDKQQETNKLKAGSLVLSLSDKLSQAVALFHDDKVFLNQKALDVLDCREDVDVSQTLALRDFLRISFTLGHFDGLGLTGSANEILNILEDDLHHIADARTTRPDLILELGTIHVEILRDKDGTIAWIYSEQASHVSGIHPTDANSVVQCHTGHTNARTFAAFQSQLATPLNGLVGMARLMLKSNPTEKQKLYCRVIAECGSELTQTIKDFAEFMHLQKETNQTQSEPVDISNLVFALQKQVQQKAKNKNLEVRYEIDHALPKVVMTDHQKLSRLIEILTDNAIKFTDFGSVRIRAHSVAQPLDSRRQAVEFLIEDTGCGIPKSEQEAIFEPFVQLNAVASTDHGGAGLGLATACVLVEQLDATICIKSDVPSGTTIRLKIPFPTIETRPTDFSHDPIAAATPGDRAVSLH